MTRKTKILRAAFAATAGLGLFMVDDISLTTSGMFVTRAHAVIGRPATPMSYAGVARRTTRQTAGAHLGAAAGGAAYAAGTCVQTVDVYGRLVMQCY